MDYLRLVVSDKVINFSSFYHLYLDNWQKNFKMFLHKIPIQSPGYPIVTYRTLSYEA